MFWNVLVLSVIFWNVAQCLMRCPIMRAPEPTNDNSIYDDIYNVI